MAELVAWTTCRPARDIEITSANVSCPAARRFVERWLREYDCAEACRVCPYTCRDAVLGDAFITNHCRKPYDPRRILELTVCG